MNLCHKGGSEAKRAPNYYNQDVPNKMSSVRIYLSVVFMTYVIKSLKSQRKLPLAPVFERADIVHKNEGNTACDVIKGGGYVT